MTQYNVLIVGGGHNGLVAAGYLAEAGLNVLLPERRDILEVACVTVNKSNSLNNMGV